MSQLENIEIKVNNEVDKIETNTNEQRVDNAVKQETESNKETKEAVIEEPIKAFQVPVAFNVISAPRVCPPGYRMDSKGKCRKVLLKEDLTMPSKNVQRSKSNTKKAVENNSQIVQNKHHKTKPPTGVIKAPKVCPSGKRVDSNGTCRAVY